MCQDFDPVEDDGRKMLSGLFIIAISLPMLIAATGLPQLFFFARLANVLS